MLRTMINFRNYRWAARLSGFLGLVLIVSFMVGEGYGVIKNANTSYDLMFLLALFGFSFLAYVIGWVIEIVGGVLLSLAGILIAFYVSFSEAFSGFYFVLLLSLPFLIPGLFFIFSWKNKLMRTKAA